MQYDWTGVRTRRLRMMKATFYLTGVLIALLSPVLLVPKYDLGSLLALGW